MSEKKSADAPTSAVPNSSSVDAVDAEEATVIDLLTGWKYKEWWIFGHSFPWYASPSIQLGMVSFLCFMCPGMFNALGGLGGGRKTDATLADNMNTALYSTFAVFSFFGGTFINILGIRWTLAFGGIGYCLYAISLSVSVHASVAGFNIFAGVWLGICAGLLWTAQGTIMISYPNESQKGRYFAWFWGIFNMGAVVGSLIPLGENIHITSNSTVTDVTYIAFIILMFIGAMLVLILCNASDVVRTDGSRIILMKYPSWKSELVGLYETLKFEPFVVLLFPMFFSSNWFYVYQQNSINGADFDTRTKALNSLLYWLAQIIAAVIWGYCLDIQSVRRSVRAKIALGILRDLPACLACKDAGQQCLYPERQQKPGPKLGSIQKPRKQRKMRNSQEDRYLSRKDEPWVGSKSRYSVTTTRTVEILRSAQRIAFIIYPSQDSCITGNARASPTEPLQHSEPLLTCTSYFFCLNPGLMVQLCEMFFDVYTSFRILRPNPHYANKLQGTKTAAQIHGLVAVMLAFSIKTAKSDHTVKIGIANSFLITHWLLIKGVKGRAWRYLGLCIRLAYEMGIHMMDAGKNPSEEANIGVLQWIEDEERRRTWWAIWEMDIFASVVRRCPTSIDQIRMEVFLPVEDEEWLAGHPQRSCFFNNDLIGRFKDLWLIKSKSSWAWFIVINSLVKEIHSISDDRIFWNLLGQTSINPVDEHDVKRYNQTNQYPYKVADRMAAIGNALKYCITVLPLSLRFRGQSLDFGEKENTPGMIGEIRQLHSSIYSIHLMIRLTELMIHGSEIFQAENWWMHLWIKCSQNEREIEDETTHDCSEPIQSCQKCKTEQALRRYFDTADSIVAIIKCSNQTDYYYVNPFLSSVIWLAAAVQVIHLEVVDSTSLKILISSSLELLMKNVGESLHSSTDFLQAEQSD
ncbi:hypothetical protein B7463_g11399, partial [Scytalidium lignicola]